MQRLTWYLFNKKEYTSWVTSGIVHFKNTTFHYEALFFSGNKFAFLFDFHEMEPVVIFLDHDAVVFLVFLLTHTQER